MVISVANIFKQKEFVLSKREKPKLSMSIIKLLDTK